MDREEAKMIIENAEDRGASVEFCGLYVRLDGAFTIEDLHAILQLMEYDA